MWDCMMKYTSPAVAATQNNDQATNVIAVISEV
jgi:hypothetical protein